MTTNLPTPEVTYANSIFSGYGHQKITVELSVNGESKKFTAVTNCMPAFDEANHLEGQDRYEALYSIIESDVEEDVIEWLLSIN